MARTFASVIYRRKPSSNAHLTSARDVISVRRLSSAFAPAASCIASSWDLKLKVRYLRPAQRFRSMAKTSAKLPARRYSLRMRANAKSLWATAAGKSGVEEGKLALARSQRGFLNCHSQEFRVEDV